jgi:hypothetical protein
VPRQVLHQAEVERQLLERQALEQRQHPRACAGGGKVIGVLNAALDAAQFAELAQMQFAQETLGLIRGDFGKYGHRSMEGCGHHGAPPFGLAANAKCS